MKSIEQIAAEVGVEELSEREMRGIVAVLIGLFVPTSRGEELLLPAVQK